MRVVLTEVGWFFRARGFLVLDCFIVSFFNFEAGLLKFYEQNHNPENPLSCGDGTDQSIYANKKSYSPKYTTNIFARQKLKVMLGQYFVGGFRDYAVNNGRKLNDDEMNECCAKFCERRFELAFLI